MNEVYPLLAHPQPLRDEKVSSWFQRIALANFIEFDLFFKYVETVARSLGFEKAVKMITQVYDEKYGQMINDLRKKPRINEGQCPFKDCNFKTISKNRIETLRKHLALMHDVGVKWFFCEICGYRAKMFRYITKHKAKVHNIGRKWYQCNLCKYKTDTKKTLESHRANIHHINIVWHCCDLCSYETKNKAHLKTHKAYVHNVDVIWHCCDLCEYKSKTKAGLRRHVKLMHRKRKTNEIILRKLKPLKD